MTQYILLAITNGKRTNIKCTNKNKTGSTVTRHASDSDKEMYKKWKIDRRCRHTDTSKSILTAAINHSAISWQHCAHKSVSARAHLQARSQSCKQKQCDPKLAKQTNTNKTNRETLKYNLRHTGDTGATSATRERERERE